MMLDWRRSNEELREQAQSAIRNTLSPMLAVTYHGLEQLCLEVAEKHSKNHVDSDVSVSCMVFEIDQEVAPNTTVDPQSVELCFRLRHVANRMSEILFGDSFAQKLLESNTTLGGRISVRYYPERAVSHAALNDQSLLGAHVDGNLFTLLWSDHSGLQVLDPANVGDVTPEFIANLGMPLIGSKAGLEIQPEQWATVTAPVEGYLLFTVGNGWLRSELVRSLFPPPAVQSAVLHRVQMKGGSTARHSIPFLVNLIDAE